VRLADGRELRAPLVLDARGPAPELADGSRCGYQKFVGRELELRADHGLELPIVMDARVDQRDGYRFFYVLPLGPRRVLVEDTRFTDTPELDRPRLGAEIDAYAAGLGLQVERSLRTEDGVLPMPWVHRPTLGSGSPFALGYRGGWMHPATGYSFPLAVRVAQLIPRKPDEPDVAQALASLARALRGQLAFACTLNRLLFRWFLPARRSAVFERFYGLPAPTIQRFYALGSTPLDRLRILAGRPPRGFSLRARLGATARNADRRGRAASAPAVGSRSSS
jgi:lycopene beta-cyclase